MSNLSEKTTIYLNPRIKKFLQFKAVNEGLSVSKIVNDEFTEMLEDLSDLKVINQRKDEKTVSFDNVLNEFGLTLDDLRNKV